MLGKNGRRLGKNTTPLQRVLKVVKCSAAVPLREFCFEETCNGVSTCATGPEKPG
jgi:hypothetical protein